MTTNLPQNPQLVLYAAGQSIQVNRPEITPVPKTRASIERLVTLADRMRDADLMLQAAEQRRLNAPGVDAARVAEAFAKNANAKPKDLTHEQDSAETAVAAAGALRMGISQASDAAFRQLQEDFRDEREVYAKSLVGQVPSTLTKLTTAVKLAEECILELATWLNMLESVRRMNLSPIGRPGGWELYLPDGIAKLRQALSVAVTQYEQLKRVDYAQEQEPVSSVVTMPEQTRDSLLDDGTFQVG